MKLKKLAIAMALALSSLHASADNVILSNEYVKVGINESTGTLGSGGNTSPGILYDSTGTATFNTSYDYLTPGSPFEGWAIKIVDESNNTIGLYHNNNAYTINVPGGAWVGTPTSSSAVWAVSHSNFNLQHTYSLPATKQYLDISTRIEAKIAMPGLYFARFTDPDARAAAGDSSSTDNVRGYGVIPKTNVVFSEALSSRYALGLYSVAPSGVNTSISPSWSSDPTAYYNNASGQDVVRGDYTIGIAFYSSGLAIGDIVTYQYAYIFGPSAFAAGTTAIEGGAGGGTAGTSSFGTLVDVGSATSAASTPTVTTTTSTSTITVSDVTAISSTLPVITASLAHHEASEGSGKQTIARETTTNVTTPMERTVVTTVRTTTTYSDGRTPTYTDSAPTTTTTLSNSVETSVVNETFSGRIDQMSELANLNKEIDRSLNMDAFRKDGRSKDDITMYINTSGSRASMNNGYNARSQIYGLAVEKNIDTDWRVGVQYNRVNTTMNGVDSTTGQDKNHFGLYSVYDLEGFKIVNNLGYADNTIKSNRTIQGIDFNNSHSTKGNDLWLNNRVYSPDLEGFRPFAGVTVGKTTINGYQEAGSIQSARTVAGSTNNYSYGEGGVRYEKSIDDFRLAGEISQTTDSFTTGLVTVGYAPNKDSLISVMFANQQGQGVNSNTVSLRGIIRF